MSYPARGPVLVDARSASLRLRPAHGLGGGDAREPFDLEGLTFEIAAGDRVALLGPNGAGKTTLLRLLAGVLRPASGALSVTGRSTPVVELASPFPDLLTPREHVRSHGVLAGWEPDVEAVLDFAGLEAVADRPVRWLSRGERARLALAPALLMDAELYLVDEGLAVCDPAFRSRAIETLAGRSRLGAAVVLAGQDLVTARALCGRGLLLERGRIVLDGDLGSVIDAFTRRGTVQPEAARAPGPRARIEGVSVDPGAGGASGPSPVLACRLSGVPPGGRLLVAVKDPAGKVLHASRTDLRPAPDRERDGAGCVEVRIGLPALPESVLRGASGGPAARPGPAPGGSGGAGTDRRGAPTDPPGTVHLHVALSLVDAAGVPLATLERAAAYPEAALGAAQAGDGRSG